MAAARFDPTINLGHILTFAGMLIGAAGIYTGVRLELGTVDIRVAQVEKAVDKIASLLVESGRQNVRLEAIERRLDRCEARVMVNPGR